MTEEALMAAYAKGDRRAFERLFATLAPRVHGFFLRAFREASVADDLMQMTFLKIHQARGDYQPERPLRPWVFSIAARVRIDEIRRRYRLAEDLDEARLERAEELLALGTNPEEDLATADLAAKVRAALARLPESQRVVIDLHRYEGMSFAEIADVLGTTEGGVKLRAFRAYERLREVIGPLLAEAR
jgi:RNA polymerase sigma-70 factor (ECF subfamily)